jgi:hypothetical protein
MSLNFCIHTFLIKPIHKIFQNYKKRPLVNIPQNVGPNEHYNNKVIHKVKQTWHWKPFGHIGDEISKKKKKTLGFNGA